MVTKKEHPNSYRGDEPDGYMTAPEVVQLIGEYAGVEAVPVRTIIWATGFRPDLSWLDVSVSNRKGQLIHDGGVTAWPGLYVIGMPFLRRRKSSLIDGAAADARDLTDHLAGYLVPAGSRSALIPPAHRVVD